MKQTSTKNISGLVPNWVYWAKAILVLGFGLFLIIANG